MQRNLQLEQICENILSNNSNVDIKEYIQQLKIFYEFLSEGNYFTASEMYNKMSINLASMIPDEVITYMDTVISKEKTIGKL